MNTSRRTTIKLSQAWRRFTVARAYTSAAEEAAVSDKSVPSKPRNLYRRLSALAGRGSASETLDEYIKEGARIRKDELRRCAKELRRYGNYETALEILEWLEKRDERFSFPDYALWLDLISNARGITAAENYFGRLPPLAKNLPTYGTLLNCYCKNLMEDKALTLFKEMEELNYASTKLCFHNLMTMYLRMGKPEEVPLLLEKMKQKNVPLDSYTYALWMQSYSLKDDTEGVERVWQDVLDNNATLCDWTLYSNLASHYVKARLYEKAELALKNAENAVKTPKRETYHFLITLYASISNCKEVYRVWESLRTAFPLTTNKSYLLMLQALSNLGDVDGLVKCFREWESNCTSSDYRLAKPVIQAYLKQGMLEEARTLYDEVAAKTSRPLFGCMELFMVYFLKSGQMDLSFEFAEAAISASKDVKWVPREDLVDVFLVHFEESKDVESANELFKILKKADASKKMAYNLLLRTCVAAGKTTPEVRRMLEEDKIEVDSEMEKLLDKVDPSKL